MRLHPVTAPYRALTRAGTGATVLALVGIGLRSVNVAPGMVVPALAAIGALAGAVYGVASYLRFEYQLTGTGLEVRHGVFGRRTREIPYSRIQNVDVSRSVFQRLLDVAAVRIETAGGGQTEAVLAFVDVTEADRIRTHIRRRTSEPGPGTSTPVSDREVAEIFRLRDRELALLSLIAFYPGIAVAILVLIPLVGSQLIGVLRDLAIMLGLPSSLPTMLREPLYAIGVTSLSGAAFLVGSWIVSGAAAINRYHGFRLEQQGDTLLYERGLLQRFSGSIPRAKIQRLTVNESVLARSLGYGSLRLETAGYAGGGDSGNGPVSETIVPIAPIHRVWQLVEELDADHSSDIHVNRPPERARRRYMVRYSLVVLLVVGLLYIGLLVGPVSVQPSLAFLGVFVLPVAVLAGHLKWRHRGYHFGSSHMIVRAGFWRRRTHVVAHYRIQSLIVSETPFQRRWSLGHLIVDTAGSTGFRGSATTAFDLDRADAVDLRDRLRDRLQAALRARTA